MEEGWNLTPILIPLITLLAGWAIGFFDSNLRTSKKIKEAEESAKVAIEMAEKKAAQAQLKLSSAAETPVTKDDPGLMRIKNENGLLTLDLDGVRVDPSALKTDQRKRLVEMLNAMRPWLEGKPATPPSSVSPPQPVTTSVANNRQVTPATTAPHITQSVSPPRATEPVPSSPAHKKENEPETAPTSIVGQINQILQARIVNTPLEAKGVSLMESVTGGVNVYVGVKRYETIDDVPDEEIKAQIRAAIAEWEDKYTPGLK